MKHLQLKNIKLLLILLFIPSSGDLILLLNLLNVFIKCIKTEYVQSTQVELRLKILWRKGIFFFPHIPFILVVNDMFYVLFTAKLAQISMHVCSVKTQEHSRNGTSVRSHVHRRSRMAIIQEHMLFVAFRY